MRFQVTKALDAIELRLRTDPILTGAIVDLAEAVRTPGPDGRPANLLRLGLVIDALSRHVADESVALYAVAERGLLSDTDLTSNERMVLRRWSDDGLVEIVPQGADTLGRVCEVASALGQPIITVRAIPHFRGARFTPVPSPGGLALLAAGTPHSPSTSGVLGRLWRCPVPGCASFSPDGSQPGGSQPFGMQAPAVPQASTQPPPTMAANGVPTCPRHQERLADVGSRPPAVAMVLRVEGLARFRFPVTAAAPAVAGRAPDGPGAVALGRYLNERVAPRISRSHLRLELRDGVVVATDLSTNGSVLRARSGANQPVRTETMVRNRPYPLGEWDTVELADGVLVGRADRSTEKPDAPAQPSSVMRDAPTVAMRLPPMR